MKIEYGKGHGKRIMGYSDELNTHLDDNVLDYTHGIHEHIKIFVTNFGIEFKKF